MQFKLYYRTKMVREDGMIEATSQIMAERVGHLFCDKHGYRYINVVDPVIARESEYYPLNVSEKKSA